MCAPRRTVEHHPVRPSLRGPGRPSRAGEAARLVDPCSPDEFAAARIPGSVDLPFDVLRARRRHLRIEHDEPVTFVCASGMHSEQIRELLRGCGSWAGLAFTAVTDTCAMARVLVTLPHHRARAAHRDVALAAWTR